MNAKNTRTPYVSLSRHAIPFVDMIHASQHVALSCHDTSWTGVFLLYLLHRERNRPSIKRQEMGGKSKKNAKKGIKSEGTQESHERHDHETQMVHTGELTESLKGFFVSGQFSDLTIHSTDQEFKVHRLVVCGQSEYFSLLFSKKWAV
ncbi:hypothetical protein ASPZODRAFT_162257, partial [Penicilliopsis zonata CBS 506.65]